MAINPFRKGGTDTIPVTEGGTGGTTASAALTNLGGLNAAAHALIDHTGFPGVGGGLPAGTVIDFAGTVLPSGWLECDGTSYTTAAQPTLFGAIGYAWGGAGPNFNVPDFRRRTTVGRGGVGTGTLGNAVGNVGGGETHTLNTTEMPNHGHGVSDGGHDHNLNIGLLGALNSVTNVGGNSAIALGTTGTSTQAIGGTTSINGTGVSVAATGGSGAHNNMQPSAVVMKIIKT